MNYQVYYYYEYHGNKVAVTHEFATLDDAQRAANFLSAIDVEKERAGIVDETYINTILLSRKATAAEIENGEADEDGWVDIALDSNN